MPDEHLPEVDLRDRLVDWLLKIVSVGGVVAYIPSLSLSVHENLWIIAAVDTVALAGALVVAWVPGIPPAWKIGLLLAMCYLLGLALLIWTGPFGAGHLFIFAFVFLAALFFRIRGIILANALAILTHAALAVATGLHWLAWEQQLDSVIVVSANFVLVSLLLTGAAYFLIQGYTRAVQEERRMREVTELLLGEIEHRVKNNLQVISSLVSIRTRSSRTPEEALVQIRDSLSAMAEVQRLLHRENFEYLVPLADLLAALTDRFRSLHRHLEFRYDWKGPAAEVDADRAASLGLLINEIVMNSVRHAFPEEPPGGPAGTVTLKAEFDAEARKLTLEIADNGRGVADETEGSGTKIIQALAHQLAAEVTRTTDGGTNYRFRLPLPRLSR